MCSLGTQARNHVVGSGSVPANLLVIGEAPGRAEDQEGEPFIGRSGLLLSYVINNALDECGRFRPTVYVTNTLACRPTDHEGKDRKPSKEELGLCGARIRDLIRCVHPVVMLLLGKVSQEEGAKRARECGYQGTIINAFHPAYVLRQGGVHASCFPEFNKAVRLAVRTAKER